MQYIHLNSIAFLTSTMLFKFNCYLLLYCVIWIWPLTSFTYSMTVPQLVALESSVDGHEIRSTFVWTQFDEVVLTSWQNCLRSAINSKQELSTHFSKKFNSSPKLMPKRQKLFPSGSDHDSHSPEVSISDAFFLFTQMLSVSLRMIPNAHHNERNTY